MKGCVMAIDGLAVRTRKPTKEETTNIKKYSCRKGGFAVNVMAGADVNGIFVMATCNHAGSTHDVIAWEESALYLAVCEGKLPNQFFFIGDDAFNCTNQMLTPWSGRGLGLWKDSFNYWLSHSRQCIERAFGMLVKRFGIFWRRLYFSYERWSSVITLCMKLHNLCLTRKCAEPMRRFAEDIQFGDYPTVQSPDNDDVDLARARGDRRANITSDLELLGKVRPPHALCRSRAE